MIWKAGEHNGKACVASGAAPNFTRYDDEAREHFIGCSGCEAKWPEHEIRSHGGMLPDHCEEGTLLPHCHGSAKPVAK